MAEAQYDLVVIGSGPGGYVCAIRAAQLGMKVACVEKMPTLGGTCLNVGCIPSKALLQASEKFEEAQHGLGAFGVKVSGVSLDLPGLMGHKDKVVSANTKGVEFLFKKNKVDRVEGTGRVAGAGTVMVKGKDGKDTTLKTRNIVIATGSDSMPLKGVEVDEKKIVSSTGALALGGVPKSMVVIGGGYIGLEMGSVWQRLGSKVIVVEFLDRILPGMDGEVSSLMQRILGKQGMSFKLGTKVTGAKVSGKGVSLTLEAAKGGGAETLETDIVLLSIGRRAYTDGLGLKEAGVNVDERGRVVTDKHFQSNVPGIYAIGDVNGKMLLAHIASAQGVTAVEHIAGLNPPKLDYVNMPKATYCKPQIASFGLTEAQAKEKGYSVKIGKFPFVASGKALAMGETDGFVKVVVDAEIGDILGAHMIGPEVTELLGELGMARLLESTTKELGWLVHPHPTISEAVKEAALHADGEAIHI